MCSSPELCAYKIARALAFQASADYGSAVMNRDLNAESRLFEIMNQRARERDAALARLNAALDAEARA